MQRRRWRWTAIMVLAFTISPMAWAQDAPSPENDDPNKVVDVPAVPLEPQTGEQPPPPAPPVQTGDVVRGFQFQPTVKNTYVVTYDLRKLLCVKEVGSANSCAVTNRDADEGGYPWTLVKCRGGDKTVNTFARSLDNDAAVSIFEAPPSLTSAVAMRPLNVRLGRVCLKASSVKKGH